MRIAVEAVVRAPADKVWLAYTAPEHIIHWNAASDDWHCPRAESDFRAGGRFSSRMEARDGSMGFDFEGIFTHIVDGRLIAYSFGDRAATVEFELADGATRVRVAFDGDDTHPIELQRAGWQAILDRFARYTEAL